MKRHERGTRAKTVGVVAALLVLLPCSRIIYVRLRGIEVQVHNVDAVTLPHVAIDLRGERYELGDIPPGGTATTHVHPEVDCHIELVLPAGHPAYGYYEAGAHGTMYIDVTSSRMINVVERVASRYEPW